jgi:hypothetical protein
MGKREGHNDEATVRIEQASRHWGSHGADALVDAIEQLAVERFRADRIRRRVAY